MVALLHTAFGALAGALVGILLTWLLQWPDALAVCIAAALTGQACKAAIGWVSRPSDETREYSHRLSTVPVLLAIAIAALADGFLLPFPATVVVPAASLLLVRILLSWQFRGPGALSRATLLIAARGGELITLLAAIMKD
jgi:hypothetical protein